MMNRLRAFLLVALVAAFGVGIAAGASAAPSKQFREECVESVMDLPALPVCKDAQGRHMMELPAIGILREPATPAPAPVAPRAPLPKTGMHVEDFAAIGLAALAGGAVLVRRLRLAVA
jgi:LPXTG-motif cell wall-anchored protein